MVHLPEWLRLFDVYYLAIYGAALLAVIILAPGGLAGLLPAARVRPPEGTAPPPPAGLVAALPCGVAETFWRCHRPRWCRPDSADRAHHRRHRPQWFGQDDPAQSHHRLGRGGSRRRDDRPHRLDPMAADRRACWPRPGLQHPEIADQQTVWTAVMAAQPSTGRPRARAGARGPRRHGVGRGDAAVADLTRPRVAASISPARSPTGARAAAG